MTDPPDDGSAASDTSESDIDDGATRNAADGTGSRSAEGPSSDTAASGPPPRRDDPPAADDGSGEATGGPAEEAAEAPTARGDPITDEAILDDGRIDPGPAPEHPPGADEVDLEAPRYYLNRELSELSFQRRVLNEAADERVPLLERLRFLGILTANLDEFCMKRIGGLNQQIDAGVTEPTTDGMTPREQWRAAMDEVADVLRRQARQYREEIRPQLADEGIVIEDLADCTATERERLRKRFETSILPTLTPLTFDPAHPFPFISNLSLSLGVLTRRPGEDPRFSRVKIPPNRPRLLRVGRTAEATPAVRTAEDGDPEETDAASDHDTAAATGAASFGAGASGDEEAERTRFVRIEEVIADNLDLLFPNVEVLDHTLFRVTRNAEVRRNEAVAEDLIETIEEVLRQRRFATVVRLEIHPDAPTRVREVLVNQLGLRDREVIAVPGPLDYSDFVDVAADLDRPELQRRPWTPRPHPRFPEEGDDRSVFDVIRDADVLVHHPYHSFDDTVQRFLSAAASDPQVLAIKIAIYRTARDSTVIDSLIEAARNGTQVAAMVELKARFDEERNLEWVDRLEEEGIHVAYGTPGYKTHTKTALIVREEDDDVRLYSHVGTGNYHSETAKTYEDLGLFTVDRDIGHDLTSVFNFFTGQGLDEAFRSLLVAPINLRSRLTDLIRREARIAREGGEGRIRLKANRLEDPALIRELYAASRAGVEIDCVIRDICRLRPGLEDVSPTIDVYSIVGRFLEHSRIFHFRNGGSPEYYVGSADWMTRNLDNRIEAVAPVERPDHREHLDRVFEVLLADDRTGWELRPDGTYVQRTPDGDPRPTHERLMTMAERGVF